MKTNFLKCCLMAVSLSVVPFASAFAADCVHKVGGLAPLSAPGSVTGGGQCGMPCCWPREM